MFEISKMSVLTFDSFTSDEKLCQNADRDLQKTDTSRPIES